MIVVKRKKISITAWALALYFVLMPTDSMSIPGVGSLLRIIAVIPLAAAVFDFRKIQWKGKTPFLTHFLLWLLICLSFLYSIDRVRSAVSIKTYTLNFFLLVVLCWAHSYTEEEAEFLKRALVIGSWFTLFLLIVFAEYREGRLTFRLGESVQNQNYVNGYLIFTYAFHFDRFMSKRNLLHLAAAGTVLVFVLLTGSRGALLAFALLSLIRMLMYIRENTYVISAAMLIILIVLIFLFAMDFGLTFLDERIAARFSWQYLSQKGTTGRTRSWENLIGVFLDSELLRKLFGYGYGTTPLLNAYNHKVAHNLYIDNLITLGLTGSILQIILQIKYLRILKKHGDVFLYCAFIGLIGMCFSLSLTSYKPIWCLMMMTVILDSSCPVKTETHDLRRRHSVRIVLKWGKTGTGYRIL